MFKVITSLFKFAFKALKKGLQGSNQGLKNGLNVSQKLEAYVYTYDINGEACDKCKPYDKGRIKVRSDGTTKVEKEPFAIPPSQTHPNCDCILKSRKAFIA